jgi:hypothetical protein
VSKVEEIVFRLIDKMIVNCDSYSHQDSFWLILTEEKKWIIEFTDSKILWFNYHFFNDIFTWVGLDDNKTEYIQKWFESRFLNHSKVNVTDWLLEDGNPEFKHVIEDGVMSTEGIPCELNDYSVENIIQNGVKDTNCYDGRRSTKVEDTIQNGVKETRRSNENNPFPIEDTIQNGVLLTKEGGIDINNNMPLFVNEVIKNGVRRTEGEIFRTNDRVEDTIQNGVKQTIPMGGNNDIESVMDFMLENKTNSVPQLIENVIQNGKKID